ncbi:MAG: DASS family sodium-coupled anion symporter [Bacteroidia bacterium]|nr:DASS family sodium-coupled anion symporter [Bacteroidia bacterium]
MEGNSNNQRKIAGLILGPLMFLITLLYIHPEGMSQQANAVLASTFWIAIWWITEAIPIAVTSLLPIVLFPLTGALGIAETTASFGHKYIFLYIGGFMLAIAIERWNLHKRIALGVIQLIGTNVTMIILGFMIATAGLSMWISNTATSVMMLPIGMAIVVQLRDNPATIENENRIFGKALMLAIAYSASIGGMATLIGTPPNLVFAGIVQELYGIEISFMQWLKVGLPISLILLAISWIYLTNVAFKFKQKEFPGGRTEINRQLKALGPMSFEETMVLVVFVLTGVAWISRKYLIAQFFPQVDDTVIAMVASVLLFVLPASKEKKRSLINWEEAVKLPWGILLLFGGGLALAQGFKISGLAAWIGGQMSLLDGISLIVLLLILVTAVNFLTEITSNLATTAMLLPILAPLAMGIGVHPYILLVGATVAASCAFMLPVATPPNAVVFGSGYLKIPEMVRVGIFMNLISIAILTLMIYFLLPMLWEFDPVSYPEAWIKT